MQLQLYVIQINELQVSGTMAHSQLIPITHFQPDKEEYLWDDPEGFGQQFYDDRQTKTAHASCVIRCSMWIWGVKQIGPDVAEYCRQNDTNRDTEIRKKYSLTNILAN